MLRGTRAIRFTAAFCLATLAALLLPLLTTRWLAPAVAADKRVRGAAAGQPPDVVVILTDDQFYDTLWSMPNVQQGLVAHGITFRNAFAANPICAPSRASILTGDTDAHTGVWDDTNSAIGGLQAFQAGGHESQTMAVWFHDAGYRTAILGKYMNNYRGGYVPPGWDDALIGTGYYSPTVYQNGVKGSYPGMYLTTLLGDTALHVIDTTPPTTPLFLYMAPYAPHAPVRPEDQYAKLPVDLNHDWPRPNLNERKEGDKPSFFRRMPLLSRAQLRQVNRVRLGQYRALRSVDDQVGRVLAALAERGTLSNAIIVFTSDNGQMWGSHRFPAPAKRLAYDESIRVPLVVRWDGHVQPGSSSGRLISNDDLAPTLTSLAGVSAGAAMDGTSFAGAFGMAGPAPRRYVPLDQAAAGTHAHRVYSPNWCGLRTRRYTFVHYANGEEELYNDRKDPYQRRNLAGPRHRPSRQLRARRRRLRARTREQCAAPPGFHW